MSCGRRMSLPRLFQAGRQPTGCRAPAPPPTSSSSLRRRRCSRRTAPRRCRRPACRPPTRPGLRPSTATSTPVPPLRSRHPRESCTASTPAWQRGPHHLGRRRLQRCCGLRLAPLPSHRCCRGRRRRGCRARSQPRWCESVPPHHHQQPAGRCLEPLRRAAASGRLAGDPGLSRVQALPLLGRLPMMLSLLAPRRRAAVVAPSIRWRRPLPGRRVAPRHSSAPHAKMAALAAPQRGLVPSLACKSQVIMHSGGYARGPAADSSQVRRVVRASAAVRIGSALRGPSRSDGVAAPIQRERPLDGIGGHSHPFGQLAGA
eukprot:scaffold2207_cov370-Prasinococcus_capsulatus_cf.AAC.14